jgi:hypothetical protein
MIRGEIEERINNKRNNNKKNKDRIENKNK